MIVAERGYFENLMDYANGALTEIMPFKMNSELKELTAQQIEVQTGTSIGFVGAINGKLVLSGANETFQRVGEAMFGMVLEGPMLDSFIGELGNMIAGSFSTHLSVNNIVTDISAPSTLNGGLALSGFKIAGWVNSLLESHGALDLYILLD